MIQGHTKFKLFSKDFSSEASIRELLNDIENWVSANAVGPKSIGVEFLESSKTIVMSIGFRDDENYNVSLKSDLIGKMEAGADTATIEAGMEKAASQYSDVICHELFITGAGDFYMVFMNKE